MTSFKRPQQCMYCLERITESQPYVGMGGHGYHWPCYDKWPDKEVEASSCIQRLIDHEKTSGYTARVYLDDHVFVEIQEGMPDDWVKVFPLKTAIAKWIRLKDWPEWVGSIERTSTDLHPLERSALLAVLPGIRATIPEIASIINRIDFKAKEKYRVDKKSHSSSVLGAHADRCRDMKAKIDSGGFRCPQCNAQVSQCRFVDMTPDGLSWFICFSCGRSMGPYAKS